MAVDGFSLSWLSGKSHVSGKLRLKPDAETVPHSGFRNWQLDAIFGGSFCSGHVVK